MPYGMRKGKKIIVITDGSGLTPEEIEMDNRAKEAVKAAIKKAEICKHPIARYDKRLRKAYIEYPDGTRKYAE